MSRAPSIWHDLECGGYDVDLPLWRELARRARPGPVLDVGAGTGRVALDLAAPRPRGRRARPRRRAARRAARARRRGPAGARPSSPTRASFALGRRFGADPRPDADHPAARRRGRPRGASCAARARTSPPAACSPPRWPTRSRPSTPSTPRRRSPTSREVDGWRLRRAARSPCATRGDRAAIERVREIVAADGARTVEDDVDRARPRRRRRARGRGRRRRPARPSRARAIPPTDEYVGSTVVMLRG